MAEEEGKKEDEFRLTPSGEAEEWITLEQARVLAIEHARDNTGFYGRRYRQINLVWEVDSQEEGEDYYDIKLSFRPSGSYSGQPASSSSLWRRPAPSGSARYWASRAFPEEGRRCCCWRWWAWS